MWFTTNPCDTKNEMWYYFITFALTISSLSIIIRQSFGVNEVTMLTIVVGTLLTAGVLFVIITFISKLITHGCFGINSWWLFLAVVAQLSMLIINEMTVETVSPIIAVPFFFLYPAISVRYTDNRSASIAGAVTSVIVAAIALICYYIAVNSSWWRGE